jgi:hypothetical protein
VFLKIDLRPGYH